MNTALPRKFPFILDRNFAKANGTGNRVCTSCDIEVLGSWQKHIYGLNVSSIPSFGYDLYFMLKSIKCIVQ